MNDYSWHSCTDYHEMIIELSAQTEHRKMRLFVANMVNTLINSGVTVPNQITIKTMKAAFDLIQGRISRKLYSRYLSTYHTMQVDYGTHRYYQSEVIRDYYTFFYYIAETNGWNAYTNFKRNISWFNNVATRQTNKQGADILRHIIRSPFRQELVIPTGLNVFETAKSLDMGEDCSFALADALRDEGCDELADHFSERHETHIEGCWALDTILGRE